MKTPDREERLQPPPSSGEDAPVPPPPTDGERAFLRFLVRRAIERKKAAKVKVA